MADAIPAILMPGIRKTSTIKRSSPAKMSDTIINTSINIFVLVFQLLYFFVADTDIQLGHFFQKLFSTFSNSKMAGVRFFFRALFPWAYCSRLSSRFSSGCHNPSAFVFFAGKVCVLRQSGSRSMCGKRQNHLLSR